MAPLASPFLQLKTLNTELDQAKLELRSAQKDLQSADQEITVRHPGLWEVRGPEGLCASKGRAGLFLPGNLCYSHWCFRALCILLGWRWVSICTLVWP